MLIPFVPLAAVLLSAQLTAAQSIPKMSPADWRKHVDTLSACGKRLVSIKGDFAPYLRHMTTRPADGVMPAVSIVLIDYGSAKVPAVDAVRSARVTSWDLADCAQLNVDGNVELRSDTNVQRAQLSLNLVSGTLTLTYTSGSLIGSKKSVPLSRVSDGYFANQDHSFVVILRQGYFTIGG